MAYRAEDISKRLVPHELYIREELEESVQFDVRPICHTMVSGLAPVDAKIYLAISACMDTYLGYKLHVFVRKQLH